MDKLSKLQKIVLSMLFENVMNETDVDQNDLAIFKNYFGHRDNAASASLSRAYRRLEKRGLIRRGKWELTEDGILQAGVAKLDVLEMLGVKKKDDDKPRPRGRPRKLLLTAQVSSSARWPASPARNDSKLESTKSA